MAQATEITGGKVQGNAHSGYTSYLGLPYAQPPIGRLRFAAPEPPEPWTGIRDASAYSQNSAQPPDLFQGLPGMDGPNESGEDCLYLNVFSPASSGAPRPVLVFVHGGGLIGGSGSSTLFHGGALASRGDVVVVTLNHRLGALGYLHLEEFGGERIGAASNAGSLDIVAALEWVRDNISAFGGDPKRVTLSGQSAGSIAVGNALAMPSSRGLFRGAIMQSGATYHTLDVERANRVASLVLKQLGLDANSVEKLREVSVAKLLEAQTATIGELSPEAIRIVFGPVAGVASLPERALAAIRNGATRDVALLIGTSRDEATLIRGGAWSLGEDFDESKMLSRASWELRFCNAPEQAGRILAAYQSARAARGDSLDALEVMNAFTSDLVFRVPAIRVAEAQAAAGARTYMYRYDWESPMNGGALAACHCLELPFMFGNLDAPGMAAFAGSGPTAERLERQTMGAWTAFCRDGVPSASELPVWPAYEASRRGTLLFGSESKVAAAPNDEERSAWDGLLDI